MTDTEENTTENSVEDVAEDNEAEGVPVRDGLKKEQNGAAEQEVEDENGEKAESVSDLIAEEIAAETNVSRIVRLTNIPEKIAVYIVAVAYFTLGVLCVSLYKYIAQYLAYIVGSLLVLIGVTGFIYALAHHEYRHTKTNHTAAFLIMTALGVMIICQKIDPDNDPITMIAIVWGVFGLFEGGHAFNVAFKRIANSERCAYYLLKGIAECAVGFILLYSPANVGAHYLHVIVFGISLILDSVTMMPKIKEFLTKL